MRFPKEPKPLPRLVSPPYARIYFDSNAFISANWPDLSQAMLNTVRTAEHLEMSSVLLDAVEKELAAHWKRDYRKTQKALIDKSKSLQKLADQLGVEIELDLPELSDIDEQYDLMVDNVVEASPLLRAKPSLRNAEELFEMAIHHRVPFKEKGKNFQDAVICLAAIDDLASSFEKVGALVSGDEIFDQDALDVLCKPVDVSLRLFKNLEAVYSDLSKLLSVAIMQDWNKEKELASQSVIPILKMIDAFVETNLEVPLGLGLGDRIVSLSRIEIGEVASVDTPPPWNIDVGDRVTISATIELKIHAEVQRQALSPGGLPVAKVGVPAKPFFVGMTTRQQSEILERSATVEIKATRTDTGYSDLEPTKVSLSTGPFDRIGSLEASLPDVET